MPKLSIIVPCYNEEKSLPIFYQETKKVLDTLQYDHELIFIDDGSTDDTKEILKKLSASDSSINYLSFSRNFGKESAMYAGFKNVSGDYVAVMDADLQDPPDLLPKMLDIIEKENYDSVATRRITREGEPSLRSWFARRFYQLINKISDVDIVDGARDFRLMKRDMVEAIVAMGEYNRFSKGIFGWVGFQTKWLPYDNHERVAGETKWSFFKLFRYAIDGIISFSQVPLSISSWLGLAMTIFSFCFMIFIIIRNLMFSVPVDGWASTVCIIVFIGGIQLAVLGIIGQYLAKTYLETKRRPHFIVSESNRKDIDKIG